DDELALPAEPAAPKATPKRAARPNPKVAAGKSSNKVDESLDMPLSQGSPKAAPGKPAQKAPAAKSTQSAAKQAQELLQQAELDLKEGRLDEAREKAQRAQKLDVVYDDVLARDPEFILAQIERAERNGNGLIAKKPASSKADVSPQ